MTPNFTIGYKLFVFSFGFVSSNYYFISRILNAILCRDFLKKKPKYNDPLNHIGLMIEDNFVVNDFSQIKTYIFKKK